MKKKFISGLVSALLLTSNTGFAAYQVGTAEDIITLSGTASPYSSVSVIMLDCERFENEDGSECTTKEQVRAAYEKKVDDETLEKSDIFYYRHIIADKNGEWSYTVPMGDTEVATLVYISNTGDFELIEYASASYKSALIEKLKLAAAEGAEKLAEAITADVQYLCSYPELYTSVLDKANVAEFCIKTVLDASADDEGILAVNNVLNTAVTVNAVNEGLITEFDLAMSVYSYDTEVSENITDEGKEALVKQLKGGDYSDMEEYEERANKLLALEEINYNVNYTGDNIAQVIVKNAEILSLDLSDFNDLSASNKALAAKKFADKKSTLKNAQSNLDAAVKAVKDSKKGSGSGSGSGSSSSGKGSGSNNVFVGSVGASVSDELIEQSKMVYSDMSQAQWAVDAVYSLSERGIINGYDDGLFRPNNSVTRAEFITMVVKTFFADFIVNDGEKFNDISVDSWYSDYVYTGRNEGVIHGDNNNLFRPNDLITRQDMAVIIYNAAEKFGLFDEITEYERFADDSSISDYAATAVYTLKENGVISGVGDNYFAPLDNATRAAAAQMIYSLINASE